MISATAYSNKSDTKSACREIKEKLMQKLEVSSEKDISCIVFVGSEHNVEEVIEEFKNIDNIGISTVASFTEESVKETFLKGTAGKEEEKRGEKKARSRGKKKGVDEWEREEGEEEEKEEDMEIEKRFPKLSAIAFDRRYIYCETFSTSVPWSNLYDFGRKIGERFSEATPNSSLIILGTPFYDIAEILRGIRETSQLRIFGGISSASPGYPSFSFENGSIGSYMISGILLEGIESHCSIAQSCEIVSDYIVITSSYENIISEIDGEPAVEFIRKTYEKLLAQKKEKIMQKPWFIGVEIDKKLGIFRFYPILDIKPQGLVIGGVIPRGSICKFGVLSGEYAIESVEKNFFVDEESYFSLFFNCVARLEGLFPKENYDIEFLVKKVNHPMAGFFTNGEIATINSSGPHLLTYTGVFVSFKRQLFA